MASKQRFVSRSFHLFHSKNCFYQKSKEYAYFSETKANVSRQGKNPITYNDFVGNGMGGLLGQKCVTVELVSSVYRARDI